MMGARFFLVLLAMCTSLPLASAQGGCGAVAKTAKAVQSLRAVQAHARQNGGAADLSGLAVALGDVPPAVVLAAGNPVAERVPAQAFDTYFDTLRKEVERHQAAPAIPSDSLLMQAPPSFIGPSLVEFQRQLGCAVSKGNQASGGDVAAVAMPSDGVVAPRPEERRSDGKAQKAATAGAEKVPAIILPAALLVGLVSFAALWYRPWARQQSYRTTPRQRCNKLVRAQIGKTETDVMIVDFNRHGMRMQHQGLIRRRCVIQFQLNGPWLKGKVMWTNDRFAGILFDKSLTDEQYNALAGTADAEETLAQPRVREKAPKSQPRPEMQPALAGPVPLPHKAERTDLKA